MAAKASPLGEPRQSGREIQVLLTGDRPGRGVELDPVCIAF
jgi:hypothetical protein